MASVTTGYISEVKIDNGAVQNIGSSAYGECSTAAATAAKTVDMTGFTTLIKGATIHVKFTNSNTVANPTLNVNNTGAQLIKRYGTTAPSTAASNSWNSGSVISFTYDGTYWQMNDWMNTDTNTTYTFDGTYNASTNKAATVSTVTTAIGNLDVSDITGFGAGKTLSALSETDGKISATFQNINITKSQVSDFPNSMTPSSHTHGNITNAGALQTNDITIANGDKLVVTDSTDSSKVARASISFDGTTTTQALTKAGTWQTFNNYSHPNSGVTAGTYRSVTVNAAGHVTAGTNPTTLSGYGITDAKISNGTITLGSDTITPLTSHQDISGKVDKSGDTMTGMLKMYAANNDGASSSTRILFRDPGNDTSTSYGCGIGYDYAGNECLALWSSYSGTSLRWHAGVNMRTLANNTMLGITKPDFEIYKTSSTTNAIGKISGNRILTPDAITGVNITITTNTDGTITLTGQTSANSITSQTSTLAISSPSVFYSCTGCYNITLTDTGYTDAKAYEYNGYFETGNTAFSSLPTTTSSGASIIWNGDVTGFVINSKYEVNIKKVKHSSTASSCVYVGYINIIV